MIVEATNIVKYEKSPIFSLIFLIKFKLFFLKVFPTHFIYSKNYSLFIQIIYPLIQKFIQLIQIIYPLIQLIQLFIQIIYPLIQKFIHLSKKFIHLSKKFIQIFIHYIQIYLFFKAFIQFIQKFIHLSKNLSKFTTILWINFFVFFSFFVKF